MAQRPTMSMPAFLGGGGSPPRSPHTAPSGYFATVLGAADLPMATPARPMSLRPTRRDVILCILTLSLSYLVFSAPANPVARDAGLRPSQSSPAPGRFSRLTPSWSTFGFGSGSGKGSQCAQVRELTFGETVRTFGVGLDSLSGVAPADKAWDGGEELLEDDEFENEATVLMGHSPGWTLFDKLYLFNGSFYVITDDREDWPELRMMTSTGLPALNVPGNSEAREPKGSEEAGMLWGEHAYLMQGTSWLFNDGQFIDHYYHFAAELLLGTWRTYASLDPDISATGDTTLPPPKRVWFLHQDVRECPRFNPTIMFALFPNIAMLYPEDFADLAGITNSTSAPKAYVFERALLADRSAAFRGPFTGPTARTVAGALQVGTASRWWWEPVRRQILRFSGLSEAIIARNLEGIGAVDPASPALFEPAGGSQYVPLATPGDYRPVVTYISRQSSRRRLTPESHAELVAALEARALKVGFELVIVEAERMTKEEQFALAGRTTIMLGVHGNGLSHLLWMPATPRSAVIEMFFRGGFARDYQWTAHALGIRHFAVQHDVSFTAPNLPLVDYPEGFQGSSITVHGETVADIIEDRLAGKI